jgi:hypothetical protein
MSRINRYVPKQDLVRNHSRVQPEPYSDGAAKYPVPPMVAEKPRQDPHESVGDFFKRIEENIRRNAYPHAIATAHRDIGCWREMLTPGQRRAVARACAEALGVEVAAVSK